MDDVTPGPPVAPTWPGKTESEGMHHLGTKWDSPHIQNIRIILWTASPLLESKRHSLTFIIIQGLNFLTRQFTFFENCPISHVQASNPYLLPTLQGTHTLVCLCSPMTFSQKWQLTRGVEARAKMGSSLGWVSKSLGRALPPLLPYLLPDFL